MSASYLRQSTASQARAIGPFVSDTDFKTASTGLTIANTDIKLVINGAASANKNSGGGTHRVNGVYSVTFDATDTATVGEMEVSIVVAGALPVFHKFWVLEEAVYDAMFAASSPGYVANAPVNVTQFGGTNLTATGGRPEVNTTLIEGTDATDQLATAVSGLATPGDIPTANENADALLKRDWTAITGSPASRSVWNALRFIRNAWSTTDNPGEVTIYAEDDTTEAYRKDVTTDANSQPIVEG